MAHLGIGIIISESFDRSDSFDEFGVLQSYQLTSSSISMSFIDDRTSEFVIIQEFQLNSDGSLMKIENYEKPESIFKLE